MVKVDCYFVDCFAHLIPLDAYEIMESGAYIQGAVITHLLCFRQSLLVCTVHKNVMSILWNEAQEEVRQY